MDLEVKDPFEDGSEFLLDGDVRLPPLSFDCRQPGVWAGVLLLAPCVHPLMVLAFPRR